MASSTSIRPTHLFTIASLLLLLVSPCLAFTPIAKQARFKSRIYSTNNHRTDGHVLHRRRLLKSISVGAITSTATLIQPSTSAAAMSGGSQIIPITRDEAIQRFQSGRQSVQYLLDHYDEICEGGGDNVRRYLGTVGISSGLFGISKALKVLGEDVDDIVECE